MYFTNTKENIKNSVHKLFTTDIWICINFGELTQFNDEPIKNTYDSKCHWHFSQCTNSLCCYRLTSQPTTHGLSPSLSSMWIIVSMVRASEGKRTWGESLSRYESIPYPVPNRCVTLFSVATVHPRPPTMTVLSNRHISICSRLWVMQGWFRNRKMPERKKITLDWVKVGLDEVVLEYPLVRICSGGWNRFGWHVGSRHSFSCLRQLALV